MRRALVPLALLLAGAAGAAAQQPTITEIQIAPHFLRMRVDAQAPLVATAYDADGIPVNAEFHWSSSNIHVAEVGPDGMVRGVAPGVAVVTAAVRTGSGKRVGQVSVYVLRGGQAVVRPVPPTPGAAPVPPSPGVWVGPPPGPPPGAPGAPRMNVDSLIRASIDCSEPFVNAINPAHACWDERARLRDPSRLALAPLAREACPNTGRTMIGLLVLVGEVGEVQEVRAFSPTGCPALDAAAEETARGLTFAPALREGRPHRSWVRIQIRTEP